MVAQLNIMSKTLTLSNLLWSSIGLLLVCCSTSDERFVNAYTEIIAVRMQHADTSVANPLVQRVLERYGYTESEFRNEFLERARQPDHLRSLIDTARARALRMTRSQMNTQQRHR